MNVAVGESIRERHLAESESHMCGITLSDSVEGRVVAELMEDKPGVTVTHYPAMIRIDAEDRLVFDMDEISEALGRDMDPYTFQIEMSTHYGRMVIEDDRTLVLYGHLDEHLHAVGEDEDAETASGQGSTQVGSIRERRLTESESHMCGITLSDSVEGRVVAELMEDKPGVTVTHYPAMIRIDAEDRLVFDMDEISEALGRDMDPYTFQIEMSTHYGRMVIEDDRTLVLYGHLDEHLHAVGED